MELTNCGKLNTSGQICAIEQKACHGKNSVFEKRGGTINTYDFSFQKFGR